ncbi:hypothetical protein CLOM_g12073 [Closterium sp. NIES-68]|nr:hypothetical protein CLOM_g12073 [Closterium sp. NIES-68]GJP81435.1 hypothetical protein CLOP_g11586 [Closterium sp. NIES-67]
MASSVLSLLDRSPDDPIATQALASLASSGSSSSANTTSSSSNNSSSRDSSGAAASSELEPERKAFPAVRGRAACEYVNYKRLGLSLCVEEGRIAAVHVYSNVHGYKAFAGTLPFGLKVCMKAKEVVEALGEPDVKAGGGSSGAVTVIYSQLKPALQTDIGMQVTFVGRSWEDAENAIDCITIHLATDKA